LIVLQIKLENEKLPYFNIFLQIICKSNSNKQD
jgi:hypothetical protein